MRAAAPAPEPHGGGDAVAPSPSPSASPSPGRLLSRRTFLTGAACVALTTALSAPVQRQIRPRTALPLPTGSLVRGANVTVKNSHYPRPWHNLWVEWDWDGWIRWQVDLARTLGVDCIRLIGSVSVVTEGDLTLERYLSRWGQLLDYLAAHDMWAYPCLSDLGHWGTATLRQARSVYRAQGEWLDSRTNVLGIDVSNEAQNALDEGDRPTALLSELAVLTATLRDTTAQPLSHSVPLGRAEDWARPWVRHLAELSDLLDVHLYYTPTPADASPVLEAPWADIPVIVGEFGIGTDETASARTARYVAVRELLASDRRFVGALAWDIASERFGLFDPGGRPRLDVTEVLTSFPRHRDR